MITNKFKNFSISYFGKGESVPEKGDFIIKTNSGVTLFFAKNGKFIKGASYSQDDLLSEKLTADLNNIDADEAIFGPSFGFSFNPVEASLLEDLLSKGYRLCCKKTNGVNYLDLPLLAYEQLINKGYKPNNIHLSDIDIMEDENFYCDKKGDKELNTCVVSSL